MQSLRLLKMQRAEKKATACRRCGARMDGIGGGKAFKVL